MSRIGAEPITIESGVEVKIADDSVTFKGTVGEDVVQIPEFLLIKHEGSELLVSIKEGATGNKKFISSMYGTIRSLLSNAAYGVKHGYEKKLEIVGVGYRVKPEGKGLSLSLGWNHPVVVEAPERISFEIPDETSIIVKGINKQEVGEITARIRELRKPEPYKGKGIRYEGEYVRRKTPRVITEE